MKNKLILLGIIITITVLIITQLFSNGAEHIEAVDTAVSLEKVNTKLVKEKEVLESTAYSLEQKITTETASSVNTIIEEKIKRIKVLVHDTVVIHDTVFIKEQKNFWGKTKRDTLE